MLRGDAAISGLRSAFHNSSTAQGAGSDDGCARNVRESAPKKVACSNLWWLPWKGMSMSSVCCYCHCVCVKNEKWRAKASSSAREKKSLSYIDIGKYFLSSEAVLVGFRRTLARHF